MTTTSYNEDNDLVVGDNEQGDNNSASSSTAAVGTEVNGAALVTHP